MEANDDLVMIGRDIPGIDAHYGRPGDNHASSVFTVRDGRIVAPHNCPTVTDGTPAHGRGTAGVREPGQDARRAGSSLVAAQLMNSCWAARAANSASP
jgi:hypothetical protein